MTSLNQNVEFQKRLGVSKSIIRDFRNTMENAQQYMSELEENYRRDLNDLVETREELETLKKRNAESLAEKELEVEKKKVSELVIQGLKFMEDLDIKNQEIKYLEEELRKYKPQDEYTDDEDMDNEDNKLTEEEKVE